MAIVRNQHIDKNIEKNIKKNLKAKQSNLITNSRKNAKWAELTEMINAYDQPCEIQVGQTTSLTAC